MLLLQSESRHIDNPVFDESIMHFNKLDRTTWARTRIPECLYVVSGAKLVRLTMVDSTN